MSLLEPFVPAFACRWIAEGIWSADGPAFRQGSGAVLTADLVGFTSVADRFAQKSAEGGAEALQAALNNCFGSMTGLIGQYGGEVLAFAGDAAIAVWWCEETALEEAVTRASACGIAIQGEMDESEVLPALPIRMRVAISSGPIWGAIVGGSYGHWLALIGGQPFCGVAEAEAIAEPGEIVLDASALAAAGASVRTESLENGAARLIEVLGTQLRGKPEPEARSRFERAPVALAKLVPLALAHRLDAGQTDWIAEFRNATVLFVSVSGFDQIEEGLVDRLQSSVTTLQRQVHAFGGQLNQLIVETSRLTALVVWGLPDSTFEDDAERAVRAANGLSMALREQGLDADLGAARGVVFAGLRGGADRLEYAVIGDPVNRAYRLMCKSENALLCDREVRKAARHISFGPGKFLALKGISEPIESFRLDRLDTNMESPLGPLVGRDTALARLAGSLEKVIVDGKSRVSIVEGEAGIGKSHLSSALAEHAMKRGATIIRGAAEAFESATAYRAWHPIFRRALDMGEATLEERQARIREILQHIPAARERESLVGAVLGVPFPDSGSISAMSAQARADATRDLLVKIFQRTTPEGARVLILEDVHWMDSASWALAEQVHRQVPALLTILVSRPFADHPAPGVAKYLIDSATEHLQLQRLTDDETVDLACTKLGVKSLPRPLRTLLLAKTEGHPFFTLELIIALRESGRLRVDEHSCVFEENELDEGFRVPDTVQGIVINRIDRLETGQQLTLKVASVLGRTFKSEVLKDVHPIEADRTRVADQLEAMAGLDLVIRAERNRYSFRHAIIRDIAYGLLPFSQRRTLHRSAAEWHEQAYPNDPAFFPLLADHWTLAEDAPKSVKYLEQAGEHSLATAAYVEAARFFRRLLTIVGELGATSEPMQTLQQNAITSLQRARWFRQLGQAEYDLGRLSDSRKHLEKSADLLGRRVPRRPVALAIEIVGMFAWRIGQTLKPASSQREHRPTPDSARELAKTLNTLGRIYHVAPDPARTIYTIIRRHNLLELFEPVPEHMITLSGWAYLMGLVRLRSARDKAVTRLKAIAARIDEPVMFADAMFPVTIMRLGQGEWAECREESEAALAIFEKYAEQDGELSLLAVFTFMETLLGNYDAALEWSTRLQRSAEEGRDALKECWGWGGIANVHLRRGEFAEAREAAQRALGLARETNEEVTVLSNLGTLVTSYIREQKFDMALPLLDEAIPMVYAQPRIPTAHHHIHGYDTMAEATLCVWEHALQTGSADAAKREKDAHRACRVLSQYAKVFAIGRPAAGVWTGKYHALRGRPHKAIRSWEQSIREGERLSSPYVTGQAYIEWARLLNRDDPARTFKIEHAMRMFEKVGARYDMEAALHLAQP